MLSEVSIAIVRQSFPYCKFELLPETETSLLKLLPLFANSVTLLAYYNLL